MLNNVLFCLGITISQTNVLTMFFSTDDAFVLLGFARMPDKEL